MLENLLKLLPIVGPVIAAKDEFVEIYETVIGLLNPEDQDIAASALADIQMNNDEGFKRLDAKLEEAKGR